MKTAFIHRNFRNLSFEKKVIFLAHLLTLIFCFFPWFYADDSYLEFYNNAFQGPIFLMGIFIFLISFIIVMLFVDRLLEKETVKLPFPEETLYFFAGGQQIFILILAWSVLEVVGRTFENHSISFGIFLVLIAQVSGLVATFLFAQLEAQKKARGFFNHPNEKKDNDNGGKPPTLIA